MTSHTHQTAPTQFVEANGIRFAYRRFGKPVTVPLVFNVHFTGTMDHWDPMLTDGFAKDREVILFDNAGISSSGGEVPGTIAEMGTHAVAFIEALGIKQADVLGFSMGGLIAQEIALQKPALVRRLVLVGTGPRSGEAMATLTPEASAIFGKPWPAADSDDMWLEVMFTPSADSQKAGRAFIERMRTRRVGRDPVVKETVAGAQVAALQKWGAPQSKPYEYLQAIKQPTLVVNGHNDVIIYTINSYILEQNIPDAQLILYPDANHGSLYQYPERFLKHVSYFLEE